MEALEITVVILIALEMRPALIDGATPLSDGRKLGAARIRSGRRPNFFLVRRQVSRTDQEEDAAQGEHRDDCQHGDRQIGFTDRPCADRREELADRRAGDARLAEQVGNPAEHDLRADVAEEMHRKNERGVRGTRGDWPARRWL